MLARVHGPHPCKLDSGRGLSSRLLLGDLRPAVPQRDGAIEHQCSGPTIAIDRKIAETFKLHPRSSLCVRQAGLNRAARKRLERVWIQVVEKRFTVHGTLGILD